MRLVLLSLAAALTFLYAAAAVGVYREETQARPGALRVVQPPGTAVPRHPETSLHYLRDAFASGNYSDELRGYLERAAREAPSFYQTPFLLAAFHANRLEQPEVTRASFEAALERFPENGRLHLTYAEWLLTPRTRAPYRTYRDDAGPNELVAERELALGHIRAATESEPALARAAVDTLIRFRIPLAAWAGVLPDGTRGHVLLAAAADTIENGHERRELIEMVLESSNELESFQYAASYPAARWGFPELALKAAEDWHAKAQTLGRGDAIVLSTSVLVGHHLDAHDTDRSHRLVRETLAVLEERELTEDAVRLLVTAGRIYLARERIGTAQSPLHRGRHPRSI